MRAARIDDRIGHTLAREGFIGGAGLGFLAGAGLVVAGILTAPVSLPLLVGAALVGAVGAAVGAGIGEYAGSLNFFTGRGFTGTIDRGSPDVFINSKKAARIGIDTVPCMKHPQVIALIAMGSENVYINNHPAARVDDKVSCGAIINVGSDNVYIGGGQKKYLEVQDEVGGWLRWGVLGVGAAAALALGGVAVAAVIPVVGTVGALLMVGKAAVVGVGGGFLSDMVLRWVGRNVGESLHERGYDVLPSEGENAGGLVGAILGAVLGVKGLRMASFKLRRGPKHGEQGSPLVNRPKGSKQSQEKSTKRTEPVEVASGRVFTSQTDFELPGRIEIEFTRTYDSSAVDYEGPLGRGWMHPYDIHLWVDDDQMMVILRDAEAVLSGFNLIAVGEKAFDSLSKRRLERLDERLYVLCDQDELRYKFESVESLDSGIEDGQRGQSEATALRLTGIEDSNGNRIDLFYVGGRLDSLQDGAGTRLNFSYVNLVNGAERLAAVNLALDQESSRTAKLVNFTYDSDGRLVNAIDRGLVPYRYAYDEYLLIRHTDRNGLSFHYAYEGEGKEARCVHSWGDRGIFEGWFEYHPEEMMTVFKDSLGRITTYYFNELDLPIRIIDPLGGVKSYSYGLSGELLSETDEIGRQTKYEYNDEFDCIRITYPDGTMRSIEYTRESLPERLVDESGAEFKLEYDQRGNLTATIDALGDRYQYSYNQFGDLEKAIDPLGGWTTFKWSERGHILELTTPLGATTRYDYDVRGRLIRVSDPLGNTLRYAYDALDRLTQIERPDGTKHHYEYDPEGNLTHFLDANGAETRFRYVDNNKLGERTDALGYRQRFVYNTEGNLIEVRNERDEAYWFGYDGLDRVACEVGFDGLTRKYDYDPAGQLMTRTDPAGRITRFIHNLRGQVLERHRPDGTVINFSYDIAGRLIEADAPGSELVFKYDALGRIIWESQNGQVIEHEYDALGRRIRRRSPSGQAVEFTYDADSRLSRLQTPRGSIAFEYDRAGQLTKQRLPGELEESFYYDRCGRLIEQSLRKPTHTLVHRGYKYDGEGNLIELRDSNNGVSSFAYDPVERLREVLQPERKVEQFVYDSTGNLLRRGERTFRYGPPDRLIQTDDATLVYDAVGNLIEKRRGRSVIRYSYDPDNQLVTVESEEGGQVEFSYDAFRRRIAKKTKDVETGFLWDGDVLLAEQRDGKSNEYIFEFDSFEPLCRVDESGFVGYHNDHMGTPRELTDEQGQVVWSASYDVYGQITKLHTNEINSPIRFQGQYQDTETECYYNFFRCYNPSYGRYTTQDHLGLEGGINLYAYVRNPVAWIDPLGLQGDLPKPGPGEPLYVGTYYSSKKGNEKTGLNKTYVAHHTPQHAISIAGSRDKGITINIPQSIHAYTRTFRRSPRWLPTWLGLGHVTSDLVQLENLLRDAHIIDPSLPKFDPRLVRQQLREIIRQLKALPPTSGGCS
jgi:RHS repeat-associated protein